MSRSSTPAVGQQMGCTCAIQRSSPEEAHVTQFIIYQLELLTYCSAPPHTQAETSEGLNYVGYILPGCNSLVPFQILFSLICLNSVSLPELPQIGTAPLVGLGHALVDP